MKHFYLLLATALVATSATAQTLVSRHHSAQTPTELRREAHNNARRTLTEQLQLNNRKPARAPKHVATATNDIVYDQPVGTLLHNWYGYKEGWYNEGGWMTTKCTNDGDADDIVLGDDGTVWLKNPVSGYPYCKAWLKGMRAEGDTIVFELPQRVYEETYQGQHNYYSLFRCKTDGMSDAIDETTQTMKFIMRNDSLIKLDTDYTMGLYNDTGTIWSGYGDYNVVISHPDFLTTVAPQDPDAAKTYRMDYTLDGDTSAVVVRATTEGTDFYISGFAKAQPDAWAKGRVEGNKVVFDERIYLGVDTAERCHTFFEPAAFESIDWYGQVYDEISKADAFTLNYDPDADTYTSTEGGFIVNIGVAELNSGTAWEAFNKPALSPYAEVAGQPEKPYDIGYINNYDTEGYRGFSFTLSNYSIDGNYLDPSKLFYRIFINDITGANPFTFEPEEYIYLTEAMTDIPYNFTDNYDFYKEGNVHHLYFYGNDIETFGVAAFYRGNDMVYPSTLVYINVKNLDDAAGIDGVTDNHGDILSTTYTDLSGRTLSQPTQGINIQTVRYADGNVTTRKFVKK